MKLKFGERVSICFNHIEWQNDALCIYFAQSKTNQLGAQKKDPRHLYANPLNPEICPILSLGLYLICFPLEQDQVKLFPGASQYDRYRKCLDRILAREGLQELESRGLSAENIGTHSTRKGAASFCSSGSTACPSNIAVHLRAGWALGGVQDRYLKYESAGDMFVGRTVAGLPIDNVAFATLPPFFEIRSILVERMTFQGLEKCLHHYSEVNSMEFWRKKEFYNLLNKQETKCNRRALVK